jgi:hypothetical protein
MASQDKIDRSRGSPRPLPAESRERLASALKRAFPLPQSGAFSDLLDAIDSSGARHG